MRIDNVADTLSRNNGIARLTLGTKISGYLDSEYIFLLAINIKVRRVIFQHVRTSARQSSPSDIQRQGKHITIIFIFLQPELLNREITNAFCFYKAYRLPQNISITALIHTQLKHITLSLRIQITGKYLNIVAIIQFIIKP